MRFIATYTNAAGDKYFRTIDADTLNAAMKDSKRYARKGFTIVKLVEKEFATN